MRSSGILRSWNDERGFGFIAPTQGGPELFVHISAFPRDGTQPVAGETVSFERAPGRDGRPQAVNVVRSMVGQPAPRSRPQGASGAGQRGDWRLPRVLLLAVVLVVGAAWGYRHVQQAGHHWQLEQAPADAPAPIATPATPTTPAAPGAGYRCDGRTHCSQMTSCAEATWFINHCPGTKMDGNHDGVPCEQQWCTGPGAR